MVAIGSSIASGIFATPSDIAEKISDPVWIMLLWAFGGLLSMCGALVISELGSRFPKAGGIYAYINESYGKFPAFLYGWSLLTVLSSGTIAALVVIFINCMQHLVGFDNDLRFPIAALSIIVLTLFNTFTIRSSALFANFSTVAKIVGIMALLVAALLLGDRAIFSGEQTTAVVAPQTVTSWTAIAAAFVSVLWTYSGWHYASFVAGEAINPKRNIPLAMILGTLTVTVVYVLCNVGYLRVFSPTEMATGGDALSDMVAIRAMDHVLAGSGNVVAILIAISVFGGAGLYVLSTPRVIKVMSEQGIFFPVFGKVHPKLGVPLNALVLQSLWSIVLVYFWGNFEAIVNYVTISEWFFLLFTCLSIFIVRIKHRGVRAPFQSVLNPFLAVIFCVVVGWFITKNVRADNPAAYFGLLLLPIGALVYLGFRLHDRSRKKPQPGP
jgi:APA family basic amino acid/polyamine antiporter